MCKYHKNKVLGLVFLFGTILGNKESERMISQNKEMRKNQKNKNK